MCSKNNVFGGKKVRQETWPSPIGRRITIFFVQLKLFCSAITDIEIRIPAIPNNFIQAIFCYIISNWLQQIRSSVNRCINQKVIPEVAQLASPWLLHLLSLRATQTPFNRPSFALVIQGISRQHNYISDYEGFSMWIVYVGRVAYRG